MPTKEAVFETILICNGQPVAFTQHVSRLEAATGINAKDFILQQIKETTGFGRLRIDYSITARLSSHYRLINKPAFFQGRFEYFTVTPIRLPGHYAQSGLGDRKYSDRQLLESLELELTPHVPLLLDGDDFVLETSRHSVFMIDGDTLMTPPLDGRILPGITRHELIRLAQSLNISVEEKPLKIEDIWKSQGLLLSNSIIGVGWVSDIGNQKFMPIPELAIQLREALAEAWKSKV